MKRLCVFCGSSSGVRDAYDETARALGHEIARRRWGLVYGGGKIGAMGAVADAVLDLGGEVIGVIPNHLVHREFAHDGITELQVVDSMYERKARMTQLANAFVALPGGVGTLDELFEVVALAQLNVHGKRCGILNVAGYYDHMLRFMETAVREGFVPAQSWEAVVVESDPVRMLEALLE
jgi:uncharacterized protein (TIGR00730 family)